MGKADIQRVMRMLDPDACAEAYELPNIMARESFRLETFRVENFDQMIEICTQYYIHHFGTVIIEGGARTPEFIRGQVWNLLDHHYQGGSHAAYKAASRGMNGGLPSVLDTIRDHFLKDQEEKYFGYTLMECVDVMDIQDITELMKQYLQRYGRHLDGENMPTAEFLVPQWREVLKAHANIVRNIRTQFGK